VLWNLEPSITLNVQRTEKGFSCYKGDPEHGGSSRQGTLEESLGGLHENFKKPIITLFDLENSTDEQIRDLFPKHEIIRD